MQPSKRKTGGLTEVPVIGHHVLRIRVVERPDWLPTRQNGPLDQRIASLIDELVKGCPTAGGELDELYPLLDALGRVCATYAQEAAYKGRNDVSEEEFPKGCFARPQDPGLAPRMCRNIQNRREVSRTSDTAA